jgi:TIR domain
MLWIKRTWPEILAFMISGLLATIAAIRTAGWSRWSSLFIGVSIVAWAVVSTMIKTSRLRKEALGCLRGYRYTLPEEKPAPVIDRQVRFTIYRPDRVRPEVWNTMLAFAYRAGDKEENAGDIEESLKQVERQAAAVIGPQIQGFARLTTESQHDIPRGESLRFVPRIHGLEFNPPERTFQWVERVHQEVFRFRAKKELDGEVVRGRMEVYFGVILIADVGLSIEVDSNITVSETDSNAAVHGRLYRKIFASYSHKDLPIVRQFEEFVLAFGDDFIRDWTHLRAGQIWSERLQSLISEADVFQLFWSRNSMVSDFVRQEWEYALGLSRTSFIRPVYWEEPIPAQPERDLPPESLRKIHFYKVNLRTYHPNVSGKDEDEVCRKFEAAWKAGHRLRVEGYLGDVSQEGARALLSEFEALERALRQSEQAVALPEASPPTAPEPQTGPNPSAIAEPSPVALEPQPTASILGGASSLVPEEATVPPSDPLRSIQDQPSAAVLGQDLSATPGASESTHIRYFGDYEIIGELARGGEGVVFRADLRSRAARGPALFVHGLRRGAEPFPTTG